MTEQESPAERILDLVLYAPVGLALEAGSLLPKLVDRGRTQIEGHVNLAKVVGMFAVRFQRAEIERRLQSVRCRQGERSAEPASTARARPAPRKAAAPTPAPSSAPAERVATGEPAPDVDALAIPDYDALAASQVVPRLAGLSAEELDAVRRYETAHRGRKTILARIAQLRAP